MFVPPADTHSRWESYEEHVCFPLAQGLAELSDRQLVNTVKVSAVMIDVIPEPV